MVPFFELASATLPLINCAACSYCERVVACIKNLAGNKAADLKVNLLEQKITSPSLILKVIIKILI
jgi:hypothetical protein